MGVNCIIVKTIVHKNTVCLNISTGFRHFTKKYWYLDSHYQRKSETTDKSILCKLQDGQYAKLYDASQVNDFAWMAARYCNRANLVTNTNLSGAYSGAQDVSESRTSQLDESGGPAEHLEGLVDNQRIEKQHMCICGQRITR